VYPALVRLIRGYCIPTARILSSQPRPAISRHERHAASSWESSAVNPTMRPGGAMRTRAEIEREIASKRRERELYVSPQGVAKCHAEIDELLDEWEAEPA
jgi:hypothetical protein